LSHVLRGERDAVNSFCCPRKQARNICLTRRRLNPSIFNGGAAGKKGDCRTFMRGKELAGDSGFAGKGKWEGLERRVPEIFGGNIRMSAFRRAAFERFGGGEVAGKGGPGGCALEVPCKRKSSCGLVEEGGRARALHVAERKTS